MILSFFFSVIVSFSSQAAADADVALHLVARSYPISGVAQFDFGYGVPLWGDPSRKTPLYGYVRGEVSALGAPGYSAWQYQFEVFPVAFAGVVAGQNFAENEEDYESFNCVDYLCRGEFREDYIEGRIAGKLWRMWMIVRHRTSKLLEEISSSASSYIHPESGLAIERRADQIKKLRVVVGFDLVSSWSLVGTYIRSVSEERKQKSFHYLGGLSYRTDSFSATLFGGTFESDIKGQGVTGLFLLRWAPTPSIALF